MSELISQKPIMIRRLERREKNLAKHPRRFPLINDDNDNDDDDNDDDDNDDDDNDDDDNNDDED